MSDAARRPIGVSWLSVLTSRALLTVALSFFLAAPARGEDADALPTPTEGLGFAPLPYGAFSSDVGILGGLVLFFYGRAPDTGERTSWFLVDGNYATEGPRFVRLKWEWLARGRDSPHVFGSIRLTRDPMAPYWGEGADTAAAGVPPGAGVPPPPYRYSLHDLLAHAGVRSPIAGWRPLQAFGYVRFRNAEVRAPGPLLASSSPPGSEGGRVLLAAAGLALDTRDREALPRRGLLAEATLFGAPSLDHLSSHAFGGVALSLRGYASPWEGGSASIRLLGEAKRGTVPFFERNRYEGLRPDSGLGGGRTLRGVARDRISGEDKALATLELMQLRPIRLFGVDSAWGAALGGDAGWARQRGYAPVAAAGTFVGLRYAWGHAILIRLDVAWAGQGGVGVYLEVEQ